MSDLIILRVTPDGVSIENYDNDPTNSYAGVIIHFEKEVPPTDPPPTETAAPKQVQVINHGGLNVRSGPDIHDHAVDRLPYAKTEYVYEEIIEHNGDHWVRISPDEDTEESWCAFRYSGRTYLKWL